MTNWLISGSRDFPDEKLARAVLRSQFGAGDFVYHGGARGVDTWAAEEAEGKGATAIFYKPDWDKEGKSAGLKRNTQMFGDWTKAEGYRRALVLWDGESNGTKHMLGLIEQYGAPLTLVRAGYD